MRYLFRLCFGLIWILMLGAPTDGRALSAQDDAQPAAFDVRPLTGRALDNLAAFVRLLGYVRHFHPSDAVAQAVEADSWDVIAIRSIDAVEAAPDAEALARVLAEIFAPYASTLRVYPTGMTPDLPDLARPDGARALVMWTHTPQGYDDPTRGVRQIIPLGDAGQIPSSHTVESGLGGGIAMTFAPIPPDQLHRADLPGGVSIVIPLALYADATGAAYPASTAPEVPRLLAEEQRYNARPSRLAAVGTIWNSFQHFHPYWDDLADLDWEAALRSGLADAALAESYIEFRDALRRMAAQTRDAHLAVDFVNAKMPAGYQPGFTWALIEGRATVVEARYATAQVLRPGDVVTKLDGRAPLELLPDVLALYGSKLEAGQTLALNELLAGPHGSSVTLTVEPAAGGPAREVVLERLYQIRPISRRAGLYRLPVVAELTPGLFYVDMERLDGASLRAAAHVLSEADGIIFDVRGYPNWEAMQILGHLSDSSVRTPPFYWPLVTRPDHTATAWLDVTYEFAAASNPQLTRNVAFLQNWQAISRSEMFLGMVEGLGLGALVGSSTAGVNGEVVSRLLPGTLRVRWTGMRVTKYDGLPLYGVGVTPTVPVALTRAGLVAGRDEYLDAAAALLTDGAITTIDPAGIVAINLVTVEVPPETFTLIPYADEAGGYQSVVPEGWLMVDAGVFQRGISRYNFGLLTFTAPSAEATVESVRADVSNSFRRAVRAPAFTAPYNGLTWEIYELRLAARGQVYVAIAQPDAPPYAIALWATQADSDLLYEEVFLPALQAFKLTD